MMDEFEELGFWGLELKMEFCISTLIGANDIYSIFLPV